MSEFTFAEMTSELREYLELCHQHPGYKYEPPTSGHPTPESEAAVNAWRAKLESLKNLLVEGVLDRYDRSHKEWFCRDETQQGGPQEHLSPSGAYRLVVTEHTTSKGCWSYTKGRVYEGDQLLTTIYRNYHSFLYAWVERRTGAFLLTGEDYQGQSVVDLRSGEVKHYLPKAAERGGGFCFSSLYPSPDGMLLAVEGCYWACPYEVRVYDISDPMNGPFPLLHEDSDNEDFLGWDDEETALLGRRRELVNLPGTPWHDKSEGELYQQGGLEALERYCAEQEIPEAKAWKLTEVQQVNWSRASPGNGDTRHDH